VQPTISKTTPLVLASSSKYRVELLRRLGVPFIAQAPELDETPAAAETPANLAQRLAIEKAKTLQDLYPDRWVLGSDQVPSLDGKILGKPGTRERAIEQLEAFSGKSVIFYTAVALLGGHRALTGLDTTIVRFRPLAREEIERYVDAEPAFDCAGSFKVEGLGVTLFNAIETRDSTALIGLPLIATRALLAQAGFALP
jgi:septum formation protein